MLQNATPLRKSASWPPNIWDEHVFCTAPATRNASLKILFKCPTLASVFGNATKPSRFAHFCQDAQSLAPATRKHIWTSKSAPYPSVFLHFWLGNMLRATTACTFSTSELPKVVRELCVLHILTSKCASRHNGVHFFNISSSKSGPNVVCFVHFWLGNVLRATTACNFSSLIWPAGSDRRPSGAPNHWKNTVFRDFPTFTRICIFFLLIFLFSLPLPCSAFHLSILSEVWLLNFLRWSCHDLYALKNVSKLGRPRWQTTRCINM